MSKFCSAIGSDIKSRFIGLIRDNCIMIFSKTSCPFCLKVKDIFKGLNVPVTVLELDQYPAEKCKQMQEVLHEMTGQKTVPNVFIQQRHIGGCSDVQIALASYALHDMIEGTYQQRQFDFIVIGGGSGGLAAAKEAASLGRTVAICDFVKPSPIGTTWGLGGTCVNVGCIPKKLMHKAASLRHDLNDANRFGWQLTVTDHDWSQMVQKVQEYIHVLNEKYRQSLTKADIAYFNYYAKFQDRHTLQLYDRSGNLQQKITGQNFLLAMGCRPLYPDIPGAKEYCITSDDLFSLEKHPGKVLIVGASYVALEAAGFLAGIGVDVTVMVRSVLLRNFDQEIAEMIGKNLEESGVKFLRSTIPVSVRKTGDSYLTVEMMHTETRDVSEKLYNTVIIAIGREPCTQGMNLDEIGVAILENGQRIIVDQNHQSTVRNIFAVGDITESQFQLTPVAIQAGRLLAQRLYGGKSAVLDRYMIPTTVFTPLEYGCIGLAEEDAYEIHGEEEIEVYHSHFQPLEWELSGINKNKSFAKLVCLIPEDERVIGFHYLGPNAGEVTQGFALALKLGATKADFDSLIGIHPTCAEIFVNMKVTKASGASANPEGC